MPSHCFCLVVGMKKEYGDILWVTPEGKVVDLGDGKVGHYDWIAKRWDKLFPGKKRTQGGIFSVPMERGWIRVTNCSRYVGSPSMALHGRRDAMKRHGHLLEGIVLQGYEVSGANSSRPIRVDVSSREEHVESFRLPDDWGPFLKFL